MRPACYASLVYRLPAPRLRGRPRATGNWFDIDLDEHLFKMPLKLAKAKRLSGAFLADLGGENRAETVPPIQDRFVAYVDPAFVKKVSHVSPRKRESDVHEHREADHLG